MKLNIRLKKLVGLKKSEDPAKRAEDWFKISEASVISTQSIAILAESSDF